MLLLRNQVLQCQGAESRRFALGIVLAFLDHVHLGLGLAVGRGDVLACPRKCVLVPWGDLSLCRNCHTSQEVTLVRAVNADKAELFHEWDSILPGSIVELLSLIEHEHLVELLIDSIAGLIQCDNCGESKNVRHRPDGFDVLEGGAGVQASC